MLFVDGLLQTLWNPRRFDRKDSRDDKTPRDEAPFKTARDEFARIDVPAAERFEPRYENRIRHREKG